MDDADACRERSFELDQLEATGAALRVAYGDLAGLAESLSERDSWCATGCPGWAVRDVVFHLLGDAQRALVSLLTPSDGPADRTAVTYWIDSPGQHDPDSRGLRATRTMASAWGLPYLVETYVVTRFGSEMDAPAPAAPAGKKKGRRRRSSKKGRVAGRANGERATAERAPPGPPPAEDLFEAEEFETPAAQGEAFANLEDAEERARPRPVPAAEEESDEAEMSSAWQKNSPN